MKNLTRLLISVFLVITYRFIICSLAFKYELVDDPIVQILIKPIELVFALCMAYGHCLEAFGCVIGYILISYFVVMGIEKLFRKMQISLRKGIIIIGAVILAASTILYFSIVLKAQHNRKKAELFIENISPRIKSDERFKDIKMYPTASGKFLIFGDIKNEDNLFDLRGIVFSSSPPVDARWSIRYGVYPDLKIIESHVYLGSGLNYDALYKFNKRLENNPALENDGQFHNDRGVVYFFLKDYDKCWEDVNKAIQSGYQVHSQFLRELKNVSGRER